MRTPQLAPVAGLSDNLSFDSLSIRPVGPRRCIEVKGRAGTGDVEVSWNEWARAVNLGVAYGLNVIIYGCGS